EAGRCRGESRNRVIEVVGYVNSSSRRGKQGSVHRSQSQFCVTDIAVAGNVYLHGAAGTTGRVLAYNHGKVKIAWIGRIAGHRHGNRTKYVAAGHPDGDG